MLLPRLVLQINHPCAQQAVADAELDGDEDMLAITASHAAKYAVQLIRQATDVACVPSKVRVRACVTYSHAVCLMTGRMTASGIRQQNGKTLLHALTCVLVCVYAAAMLLQLRVSHVQAQQVVTDLAAATLSMLSQRPPAHEVLATAGEVL